MARRVLRRKKSAGRGPVLPGFAGTLWWPALVIILLGFVAYYPALTGDWLWDDDFYLTANPLLHDPHRLWKIWFEPGSTINYFPITATVQLVQWKLLGIDTLGYHLTNVLLHLIGALLVWRLLAKLGLRFAWIGGLLFAVHPTAVESVAWISEIKNTLSLPPFLLAMCAWIDFENTQRRRDYATALVWFIMAMLCKTTMVAFPVVILLYAWWKRDRLSWRDVQNSLPFFAVSLILGLLNVLVLDWIQHHQQVQEQVIPVGGFLSRLACSGLAMAFYLSKAIFPVGLLPMYPQWSVNPPLLVQFLPWLFLLGLTVVLWKRRATWGRHVALGLGFFILNLAPFTGFVTNSFMRFTWVMDHFLYIPIIGIIGLAVAGAGQLYERVTLLTRKVGVVIFTLLVFALTAGTYSYASIYIDQKTMWIYTIDHFPGAWLARNNLSNVLSNEGRYAEAIKQLDQSLADHLDNADAHYNKGVALLRMGDVVSSMAEFRAALQINPHFVQAINSLGNAYIQVSDYPNAGFQFREATEVDPGYPDAHNNLGNVLAHDGHLPEALAQYEAAIAINPDFAAAHNSRGVILARLGRIPEAVEEFKTTLRLDPGNASAAGNLAQAQGFLSSPSAAH